MITPLATNVEYKQTYYLVAYSEYDMNTLSPSEYHEKAVVHRWELNLDFADDEEAFYEVINANISFVIHEDLDELQEDEVDWDEVEEAYEDAYNMSIYNREVPQVYIEEHDKWYDFDGLSELMKAGRLP